MFSRWIAWAAKVDVALTPSDAQMALDVARAVCERIEENGCRILDAILLQKDQQGKSVGEHDLVCEKGGGCRALGRSSFEIKMRRVTTQSFLPKAKAKAKAKAKGKVMKTMKGRKKRLSGTVNMTIDRYVDLVNAQFKTWRKNCFGDNGPVHLIQDHEACLWNERSLAALEKAGFSVVDNFLVSSPDLNAIEGWWHRMKRRLDETAPTEMETRSDFLVRLRRVVHWLNENAAGDALALCQNQKERAKAVKKLQGARCKW